jgi:cyclase
LRQGADKVSLNSRAVANPQLIKEAANRFGSQCIVLSIDAKKVGDSYRVTTQGGRQLTDLDVLTWAEQGVALGAGEIVLNTMDTDGVQGGYDVALIAALTRRVNVPVIASGGAGTALDFVRAAAAGADGLLAASVFHFGTLSIAEVKEALREAGFPIRKEERYGT